MTPPVCLFLDPCGPYPVRLLDALAGRGGKAVALFTSATRAAIFEHRWSAELGRHLLGERRLEPAEDLGRVAAELHARWPQVAAIVPWDEDNVVLGADLAERMGIAWCRREVIERCRDKGLLKRFLRAAAPELRLNRARVVGDRAAALAFAEEVGRWPLVVKPSAGSGSEHVFFADHPGALLRGCQRVLERGAGEVLLEEYVGGDELAVDGLTDAAGSFQVTDVWLYDRRQSHGVPNLYYEVRKVNRDAESFAAVCGYARRVVETVGLCRCPVHMEVKVDAQGPCLIELGSRFGGISLPVLASRLHRRDLFAVALRHYLEASSHRSDDLDWEAYDAAGARVLLGVQSQRLPSIGGLQGAEEVEALASFAGWGLRRPAASPAPLTVDLDSRAWELTLLHADPAQLASDADRARRLLRYTAA